MTALGPEAADNERWRFDLGSHVLFAPDTADGPADGIHFWRTSHQHEIAHWVRWQSSSVGLVITLLRRARAVTALEQLDRLNMVGRQRVVDLAKQRPLWSYATGYEPKVVDESFGLSGQMWLDMRFLEQSLLDSSDGLSAEWPADAAVGPALSDAWRGAVSFLPTAPHAGNTIADHLFVELPGAAIDSGFRPDARLTTRAIWESACTLDELDVADHAGQEEDSYEHRRLVDAKVESDAYGFALRVASGLAGTVSSRLFRLIAWLATDPPLPFLQPFNGHIRWSEFHPPYRFMRLYAAVRDHSRLRKVPPRADLYEFADDLLRAAKLERANWPTTPVRPGIYTREGDRTVALHDWTVDYDTHPGFSNKYVGSLNMLVKASLALRAAFLESPSKIVYPNVDTAFFADQEIVSWIRDVSSAQSLLQPLVQDFSNGLFSGGIDPETGSGLISDRQMTNYVASVLVRESLDALITGMPVRRSQFPRNCREWGLGQPTAMEMLLLENYVVATEW